MEWEMHLYVERRGRNGWVPVCPPLPSSPRAKAKWGVYTPDDPLEAMSVACGGDDLVPTKAPRWDFGRHPVGMQQLSAFYSFYATPDGSRDDGGLTDAFLEPCGLPLDASEQVRAAAKQSRLGDAEGIWYTLRELKNFVFRGKISGDFADRRVVALRDELTRINQRVMADTCSCKRGDCFHRDELIRAVVWTAKRRTSGV